MSVCLVTRWQSIADRVGRKIRGIIFKARLNQLVKRPRMRSARPFIVSVRMATLANLRSGVIWRWTEHFEKCISMDVGHGRDAIDVWSANWFPCGTGNVGLLVELI